MLCGYSTGQSLFVIRSKAERCEHRGIFWVDVEHAPPCHRWRACVAGSRKQSGSTASCPTQNRSCSHFVLHLTKQGKEASPAHPSSMQARVISLSLSACAGLLAAMMAHVFFLLSVYMYMQIQAACVRVPNRVPLALQTGLKQSTQPLNQSINQSINRPVDGSWCPPLVCMFLL